MTGTIVVHPDPESGGRAVADRLLGLAAGAIAGRGRFVLGVSGGEGPKPLFRALARGGLPDGAYVFWCDERLVPATDPLSNYGLARRLWLEPSRFPADRTFPIPTDATLEAAASRYEATLRRFFGPDAARAEGPATFDALVLGVGPDGHTASLFPRAPSLEVADRWVVGEPQPARPPFVPRVSLTLEAIRTARLVVVLAWGAEKRGILRRIFADPGRGGPRGEVPAARVQARESVEWHIDRAAAP